MDATDSKTPARVRRGNVLARKGAGGKTRYLARVRRAGAAISATFTSRAAADAWLRQQQAQQDLERAGLAPPPPPAPVAATVGELFSLYRVNVLASKRSPKTRADQGHQLDRWERFLGPEAPLQGLTPARLELFKQRPRERGDGLLSAASIVGHFRLLHHVLGYAASLDLMAKNPADAVRLPAPGKRERWLTSAQADALLQAAEGVDPELHTWVAVALYAGLRRSEVSTLTWGQVDLGPAPAVTVIGKGVKVRSVPLVPELADALRSWRDRDRVAQLPAALVFPHPGAAGKPYDPRIAFERARERAGLPWVTPHTLRHTTGSRLGQAGVSAFVIADALGHSDIRTTQRYVHLDDATRRQAMLRAVEESRRRAGKGGRGKA